jgi:hypothetical protein
MALMEPSIKKVDARAYGAFSLRLWAILFVIPHFATHIIIQQHGVLFAFTSYYWLVDIGILTMAFILAWKYDHPITQVFGLGFGLLAGYISFRYLEPRLWYFNPGMFIIDIFMAGLLSLNIIRFLFGILYQIGSRKLISRLKSTRFNRKTLVFVIIGLIWISLTAWSYFGFSQTYLVEDSNRSDFRVSFWGIHSAGFDYSLYNNAEADEELALYQQLNTSFIFGINKQYFSSPTFVSNMSAVLHEYENWGIEFILDCSIIITLKNETSGKMIEAGEYVTYYYLEEFNTTVDLIMDWVALEGFTNFRGISLDIEPPIYRNSSKGESKEQYELAKKSFSAKFTEFRERFPGKIINGISMEGTMWDPIDGDYDLDIAALTISNELELDVYGYMTYHTGSASLTESDYRYASFLQHGVKQHGDKFQPWVGWWYDPISSEDPNVIENPIVYKQTIQQFKIAKSMGVSEFVLAPLRNFLGKDISAGLDRLRELVNIKENGFESFEIPITQDMRLIHDFPYWFEKIHSTYWISNDDVLQDILMGTRYNWLFWLQVAAIIGSLTVIIGILKYGKRKEVKNTSNIN